MEYTFFQNHSNLNVAEIGRISVILSGPASRLVIVMTEHVTEGFLVLSHRFFPSGCYCEHNDPIWPETVLARRLRTVSAVIGMAAVTGRLRHDSAEPTALRYSVVKDRYCKSAAPGGLTVVIGSSVHRFIGSSGSCNIRQLAIQVSSDTIPTFPEWLS
jgi:hypothetical protein